MTPARVQLVVRRITFALAAAGGLYLYTRFSLMTLPESGCTPVLRYAPGTSLLLDRRPSELALGDGVLFESEPGVVSLGSIGDLRADGSVWIAVDAPDCPAASSEQLGWIPREQVAARVVFATNW
ncbi:MAG: hypothetical protein H6831_06435 [Planctomycetes bacterium]|nr:hypothetical protein [Planctomycetota bacterium]MCB9904026.1 hypothetical protein [Planctomycetota bacterium]